MKRIISLLLVLIVVLMTFVACTGDEQNTEAPTDGETIKPEGTLDETNEHGDNVLVTTIDPSEHDYNGESITMLIRNDEKIIREFGSDTSTEEINENILTRNDQVATNLNLVFIPEYIASGDAGLCRETYASRIKSDVTSGLHTVDMAAFFGYYASDVAVREYSANLLDEETFPYFDFTLPCWNQSIVKNSNINGKSFVCGGDITLSIFNFAMIMWHNKTLYEELRDKQKDPEDMQDVMLAGEWTADKLYKWAQIYHNTSSADNCDTYGVSVGGNPWPTQPVDALPFAWQLNLMTTNADGTHAFNVVGNTKAEEAVVYYRQIFNAQGNGFHHDNCGGSCGFIHGNYVFSGDCLSWDASSGETIRSMEEKYCLFPWPKWDELQVGRQLTEVEIKAGVEDLGYYTTAQDCYSIIGVLDHSESSVTTKGNMVSAYLQYTSELSYTDVRGYYFDKVLRGKTLGLDDEDGTVSKSIRTFNMIMNNLQFEYWYLYSASLAEITHLFRGTAAGSGTLEEGYNTSKAKYDEALRAADVWFGLIEDDAN